MDADWEKGSGGIGMGLRPFERKVAGADNIEYAVDSAERKDLAYLVENSCLSCNRQLKSQEIKIVPPRYIQERDYYVKNGAVSRRLMCVACYNALKTVTRTRIKIRHSESIATKRSFLLKTVINNLLLK
jgi:hypothetical protein